MIDPETRWAEFYELEEGHYRPVHGGRDGEYRSRALPGFWLRTEWLWQEPLPHPLRILGEIVGVDLEMVERFLWALAG